MKYLPECFYLFFWISPIWVFKLLMFINFSVPEFYVDTKFGMFLFNAGCRAC